MAYSRFIEEIEVPAMNGVSDENQPPETDDEDDSEQDDSEQDDGMSEEVDDNSNEEDDATEASDDKNESREDEGEDSENLERAFEERTENLVNDINRCKEMNELEQVAEFKQQLSEVVNEHFLWLESRRQQQVEALEQRLEKLKKLLDVRSKNSDKIINRRIQTLLDEPDALDWKIK